MKKTFIGLAVFAMSFIPAVAVAQNQSNDQSFKVENIRKGKSKEGKSKKDRKVKDGKQAFNGKKCDKKGRASNDDKCKKLYNDSVNLASLNLNETQKAQVKALDNARRTSMRELRENARKSRMSGDTTFVFDGSQVELIQSKYLKDLRAVLTSDQYVQFLENNYVKGSIGKKGPGKEMHNKDLKCLSQRNGKADKAKKAIKAMKAKKQEVSMSTAN